MLFGHVAICQKIHLDKKKRSIVENWSDPQTIGYCPLTRVQVKQTYSGLMVLKGNLTYLPLNVKNKIKNVVKYNKIKNIYCIRHSLCNIN